MTQATQPSSGNADTYEPHIEPIGAALDGMRLDRAVALLADVSRSTAARLVTEGDVQVNGVVVTAGSRRVAQGECLLITATVAEDPVLLPDEAVAIGRFAVVFEDSDIVVVDKQAGLVVHPGAGHDQGTLVNGLLARYPEIAEVGDPARPGIVHRLDRDTSGLLVVARSERAYQSLVKQMRSHQPERVYYALIWGHPEASAGVVDAPVGRSSRNPLRMTVTEKGRTARTHYQVKQRFTAPARVALLDCRLETGRTHQIRVHLRAIGHPVVGDPAYGIHGSYGSGRSGRGVAAHDRTAFALKRPFLHAHSLAFSHPVSGEIIKTQSPLPEELAAVLAACS